MRAMMIGSVAVFRSDLWRKLEGSAGQFGAFSEARGHGRSRREERSRQEDTEDPEDGQMGDRNKPGRRRRSFHHFCGRELQTLALLMCRYFRQTFIRVNNLTRGMGISHSFTTLTYLLTTRKMPLTMCCARPDVHCLEHERSVFRFLLKFVL